MNREVKIPASQALAVATRDGILVPRVIAAAGDKVARRFLEFFAAIIRNKNTRMAYYRAAARFFAWCDHHKIGEVADIEPPHVAAYVEALGKEFEKPTVKQHLAAIRMLFDWLVTGQVVATNPAHSVRGPKHVVKTGKTTVLTVNRPASCWTVSTRQHWSACATGRRFR
jgi:site-specific recombinase XerD